MLVSSMAVVVVCDMTMMAAVLWHDHTHGAAWPGPLYVAAQTLFMLAFSSGVGPISWCVSVITREPM